jgi:predicted ATP-dependent protease
VADGKFHIWAVGHADEALELLTGLPAGQRQADGTFEPDTVNGKVDAKLKHMMELAKLLMKGEEGSGKSNVTAPSCPSCGK